MVVKAGIQYSVGAGRLHTLDEAVERPGLMMGRWAAGEDRPVAAPLFV